MTNENQQVINLQVTEGLAVAVIQNTNYDFLMPVKDVAKGYGVSTGNIRNQMFRNQDEFKEGRHFVKGVSISNTLAKGVQPHAVFWTKAGIVRLGFFIKSERAKLFRDWAESVILEVTAPTASLPPIKKRNHNRLTANRKVDIMKTICKISDEAVRMELLKKLGI